MKVLSKLRPCIDVMWCITHSSTMTSMRSELMATSRRRTMAACLSPQAHLKPVRGLVCPCYCACIPRSIYGGHRALHQPALVSSPPNNWYTNCTDICNVCATVTCIGMTCISCAFPESSDKLLTTLAVLMMQKLTHFKNCENT